MALIPGKQIETGALGIGTANLQDNVLSADAAGRAKIASGYFDSATVTAKFASGSIALDRLAEAVIQADGGQAFTANQSMGGFKLTSLGNGTAPGDAVNLSQLQGLQAGLSWKQAVKAATTAAISVAVTYANGTAGVGATLTSDTDVAWSSTDSDGISLSSLERILVKNQASGLQNGIYELTQVGSNGVSPFILTRVVDCDTSSELDSAAVFVQQGSTNGDKGFTQTADAPSVGTTALVWTQFTGAASLTYGTPGTIQPDDSAAEGVASTLARSDHRHAIAAAAPGSIQPDDSASEGVSTSFARADHVHAITCATAAGLGSANSEGVATSFSRSDHVHQRDVERQEELTSQAIITDTALTDTLNATPVNNASVQLWLNGLLQLQGSGKDYTVSGDTITWLAGTGTAVDMATTDIIIVKYISAS